MKYFVLFLTLTFIHSVFFAEGLDLFNNPKLIKQRNSKSGIQQLLSIARQNVKNKPSSYDYNWQYAALLYFFSDFYHTKRPIRLKLFDMSRKYALKAIKLNPQGVEGHFIFGVASALWADANGILQSLFMADDVAREMTAVIKINPAFYSGIPWAIRAQVYGLAPGWPLSVGDRKKADADFKKAFHYNHNYRVIYQLYTFMLTRQNRWKEALISVNKGLALPYDATRPWEEHLAFTKLKGYKKEIEKHLK